jgi:probable rRNA maturation factor
MIIRIDNRQKIIGLNRRLLRSHIRTLLRILQLMDKEISLVFTDNKGIQEINRDYLDRDRPTNVISFAIGEGQFSSVNPQLLGDIVISVERAMSDANKTDLPLEDELDFLIIHGLLHLIGYNHEDVDEKEALRMGQKEQELFAALKGYQLDLD